MRALRRPSDDIMEAYTDDTDDDIQALLEWIDSVPLSRPKKNLSRDFADGGAQCHTPHHTPAATRPPPPPRYNRHRCAPVTLRSAHGRVRRACAEDWVGRSA